MANLKTNRSTKVNSTSKRGRPRAFDRDQALKKSMHLFWQNGYEATTMADLRETLGLTQASIYAAFGGKEQLFREAVDLYQRTSGATTSQALEEQTTAKDSVRAMLINAANVFTSGNNPPGCLVVLGTMNCSRESKPVQDHLHSIRTNTPKSIAARLKRGQHDGDLPPDAPVDRMAAYFTTVLHGLSIQARDGVGRRALGEVVDCVMATWDIFVARPKLNTAQLLLTKKLMPMKKRETSMSRKGSPS